MVSDTLQKIALSGKDVAFYRRKVYRRGLFVEEEAAYLFLVSNELLHLADVKQLISEGILRFVRTMTKPEEEWTAQRYELPLNQRLKVLGDYARFSMKEL